MTVYSQPEELERLEAERDQAIRERDDLKRNLAACEDLYQKRHGAASRLLQERDQARSFARRYHEWLRKVARRLNDGPTLAALKTEREGTPWLKEDDAPDPGGDAPPDSRRGGGV